MASGFAKLIIVLVVAGLTRARPCVEVATIDEIRPGMTICRLDIDGDLDLADRNLSRVSFEFIRATERVRRQCELSEWEGMQIVNWNFDER